MTLKGGLPKRDVSEGASFSSDWFVLSFRYFLFPDTLQGLVSRQPVYKPFHEQGFSVPNKPFP
jgi:hypothetical protein